MKNLLRNLSQQWDGNIMIIRLQVENWRKFSKKQEWKFDKGLHLIFGSNASGKSSILGAIDFAFFGIDENIDDIPTYNEQNDAIVELDFNGVDGEIYRIVRSYKKIKRKKEEFHLYKLEEGNEVHISEKEERAIELFGAPPDIFSNIVFLKEGEIYRALSKNKNTMSEELAQILNLDRFDKLADKLRNTRLQYAKQLKNFAKENLPTLTTEQKKDLQQKIFLATNKIKALEEEKNKLKEEQKQTLQMINLVEKRKILGQQQKETGETIKKINKRYDASNVIEFLKSQIEQKTERLHSLEKDLQTHQNEKQRLVVDKETKQKFIRKIEEFEGKALVTCPTCYQEVDPALLQEAKHSFKNEAQKLDEQITTINATISSLEQDITETNCYLETANEDKETLIKAKESIGEIQEEINKIDQEVQKLPERKEEEYYDQELKRIEEESVELKVQRKNAQKTIDEANKQTINPDDLEYQEKFIKLVEKKVEGYKEDVLKKRLDEVKELMKEKWAKIWKKKIWSIDFDKNYIPHITYKGTNQTTEQTMRGLSGSEKIMLSIIMRAAILEKIMGTKTMILDDPSIFLDDTNLQIAADFYNELIANNQLEQIILTSFDDKFKKLLNSNKLIEL